MENTDVYNSKTQNFDQIERWSSTQVYLSKGFVYPFLHSITAGAVKPPAGYSQAETRALLESCTPEDIPEEKKVDLIAIQLEAFADFSLFDGVEGIDFHRAYEAYHALEAESYTGNLVTNIFAGGTVDTERAFLTGFADQQNYRADTNSYAWYLRSQGYAAEGCHPSYEWFYNRRNVNGYLGGRVARTPLHRRAVLHRDRQHCGQLPGLRHGYGKSAPTALQPVPAGVQAGGAAGVRRPQALAGLRQLRLPGAGGEPGSGHRGGVLQLLLHPLPHLGQ